MDINTMMLLMQTTQTQTLQQMGSSQKENSSSFEDVLNKEVSKKEEVQQKDDGTKKEDAVQKEDNDTVEKENGIEKEESQECGDSEQSTPEEQLQEVLVSMQGSQELLAALLLNQNDNATVQVVQQTVTDATTQVQPVNTVVQQQVQMQEQQIVSVSDGEQTLQQTPKTEASVVVESEQLVTESVTKKLTTVQSKTDTAKQSDVMTHTQTQNSSESETELTSESAMQTKTVTFQDELQYTKVSDVVSVEKGNVSEQLADKILMQKEGVFELQLNPEHLGKIKVEVAFENGETKVSILCTSQKALDLLTENKSSLIAVLENRTGNTATVQVQVQEEKDLMFQKDQQQQEQQQQQQQQKQKQNREDTLDFLQQLRLGLV